MAQVEVRQRPFPRHLATDVDYPVVIWQDVPEILKLAIFDHTRNSVTIRQAERLNSQILYEVNDFVWEAGRPFRVGKMYKGVATFNAHGNLKTLRTAERIAHIFY